MICKTASPRRLPAAEKLRLHKRAPEDEERADSEEYRSMIGSLLYACHTRPAILMAVSAAAKYSWDPSKADENALRRIMRYLNSTLGMGLFFRAGGGNG